MFIKVDLRHLVILFGSKKRGIKMSVVQEKKLSESYCLLIGLQHDLTVMKDLPDKERNYIESRLGAIEKTLLSGIRS